ncbi:MAG: DUF899 family protein [Labedaea sp.]
MTHLKPKIATAEEWQKARDELLAAEKEATRALDALAARRRRLPMVRSDTYTFDTTEGPRSLLDLFDGREEMILYQFMNNGPENYCPGCTWWTNNMPSNASEMLADKGITWVHVSDMPLAQILKLKEKMGWTMTFASSHGTSFSRDTGAGNSFLLSVYVRDGEDVYKTYTTTARGYERMAFVTSVLDLTVYGRRESWEDSPADWPQDPTYLMPTTMEPHHVATGFGTFR